MPNRIPTRGDAGLTIPSSDPDALDGPTSFVQGQADQHQACLAGPLIPSGHVDEEVGRGLGNGGVVAVDNRRERQDVVVGVEYHRERL